MEKYHEILFLSELGYEIESSFSRHIDTFFSMVKCHLCPLLIAHLYNRAEQQM